LPELKIDVIDSRQLATSLGVVVSQVAELLDSEPSHDAIVAHAKELCGRAKILVSVRTLEYMVRGGRVSPLKGFMAKLFNLKPIVSVDADGKSQLYGKSFGYQANIQKIRKMVNQAATEHGLAKIAVGHVDALEDAEALASQLEADTGLPVSYIYPVSPIIGVHAGIGAVCVSYLTKEE
jgi:DegV family protein with EDD domain